MAQNPIRVGIIGADTKASWAGAAHVPALASQPQFTLQAVATRQAASAQLAAKTFGAQRWYADPYELVADPTIDLVTVAVKVPAHRDLVLAALQGGKAVYCEAPLGSNLAQAEEMAAAAGALHTAIGLQGRMNPAVRRAAQIVAEGLIGRVLSARVDATTVAFGPTTVSAYEYFEKADAGASFLTITTAHVLDVVEAVLGEITQVDARTELLWPDVLLTDTGVTTVREIADHVDIIARTASGSPVSVQVRAGVAASDAYFGFELRGSDGWLRLTGSHPAGVQVGDLKLTASADFTRPDASVADGSGPVPVEVWRGAPINVAEVYASFGRDIANGTFETPGFAHAVHNSRLIARVELAAQSGQRQ